MSWYFEFQLFIVCKSYEYKRVSLLLAVSFAAVTVLCRVDQCWIRMQTGRWLAKNMNWRRREQRGWQWWRDIGQHMWEERRRPTKERAG